MKNIGFVLLVLLMVSCGRNQKQVQEITPPFKDIEISKNEAEIDPSKAQTVALENGTSLDIPENAFVDSEGNVITEPVTITMENYSNAAEIIASGIPMEFNDGENTKTFESAGMFDIRAFANGANVEIASDKEIGVNYASATNGEFDLFYFDENESNTEARSGEWKQLTQEATESTTIHDSLVLDSFKLKFDADSSFPELKALETINWKLAANSKNPYMDDFDWVENTEWTMLDITQPKYGSDLSKANELLSFEGWPRISPNKNYFIVKDEKHISSYDFEGNLLCEIERKDEEYTSLDFSNEGYCQFRIKQTDYFLDTNGSLMCTIDSIHSVRFFPEKKLIVGRRSYKWEDEIVIYDFEGKKKFSLDFEENLSYSISKDGLIAAEFGNEIKIYDLNLSVVKEIDLGASNIYKYGGIRWLDEERLLLELEDGNVMLYDIRNDTKQFPNEKVNLLNTESKKSGYAFPFLDDNHVLIRENRGSESRKLWNTETNKLIEIDFKIVEYSNYWYHRIPIRKNFPKSVYLAFDETSSEFILFDLNSYKKIARVPTSVYPFGDMGYYHVDVLEAKNRALITIDGSCYLIYLKDGVQQKIALSDSSIILSKFTKDEHILVVLKNGSCRKYDLNGGLISTQQIDFSNNPDFASRMNSGFEIYRNYFAYQSYTEDGVLQLNYLYHDFDKNSSIIPFGKDKNVLTDIFQLSPNVYELELVGKSVADSAVGINRSFRAYVYLNSSDKIKIERFKKARKNKLKNERQRAKKESNFIRSFAIKKFGIYNYDRFVADDSRLHFAADFDFGENAFFNNITVFLITDYNGPSLVKFYKGSWDKFSIDPKAPNRLVAILPENKVAVLTNEQLSKMDLKKASRDGKFTFKMDIIDEPITSTEQLNELLQ